MSGVQRNPTEEQGSSGNLSPSSSSSSDPDHREVFSQKAISRAVLKTVLQKPYVLYPSAIGLLGFLSALLLGPDPYSITAAVLGLLIGGTAWAIDFNLRKDIHASRYLAQLHTSFSNQRERFIQNLEHDLQELGFIDGISQLNRLQEKYVAFERLLGRKLNPSEITFSRYLGMAEQVYLSSLDNLQKVVDVQQGSAAIDESFLVHRLTELKQTQEPNLAQRGELEALEARLKLKQRQSGKIDEWLMKNERAMTQLDLTMAAIAEMDTVQGQAGMDMESAMDELQLLAARSSDYDHKD